MQKTNTILQNKLINHMYNWTKVVAIIRKMTTVQYRYGPNKFVFQKMDKITSINNNYIH